MTAATSSADHPAVDPVIDVHAHVVPHGVDAPQLGSLRSRGLDDTRIRLSHMDATGVDIQALSPWMELHPGDDSAELVRRRLCKLNDGLLDLVASVPGRFLALPLVSRRFPHVASHEAQRLRHEPAVVGVAMPLGGPGPPLHGPDWDALWQTCAEARLLVLLHPWRAASALDPDGTAPRGIADIVDNPAQSTATVAGLILEGVLDRHPGLHLCVVHGGGMLPWLLGRLDAVARTRGDWSTRAILPSSYVSRLWFDSLTHSYRTLAFLGSQVGTDRVLLGTDFPFPTGAPDGVHTVRRAFSPEDAERVLRTNARTALPLSSEA